MWLLLDRLRWRQEQQHLPKMQGTNVDYQQHLLICDNTFTFTYIYPFPSIYIFYQIILFEDSIQQSSVAQISKSAFPERGNLEQAQCAFELRRDTRTTWRSSKMPPSWSKSQQTPSQDFSGRVASTYWRGRGGFAPRTPRSCQAVSRVDHLLARPGGSAPPDPPGVVRLCRELITYWQGRGALPPRTPPELSGCVAS